MKCLKSFPWAETNEGPLVPAHCVLGLRMFFPSNNNGSWPGKATERDCGDGGRGRLRSLPV